VARGMPARLPSGRFATRLLLIGGRGERKWFVLVVGGLPNAFQELEPDLSGFEHPFSRVVKRCRDHFRRRRVGVRHLGDAEPVRDACRRLIDTGRVREQDSDAEGRCLRRVDQALELVVEPLSALRVIPPRQAEIAAGIVPAGGLQVRRGTAKSSAPEIRRPRSASFRSWFV
jgi:hypothetical protein